MLVEMMDSDGVELLKNKENSHMYPVVPEG